jgi:hypothetical protein
VPACPFGHPAERAASKHTLHQLQVPSTGLNGSSDRNPRKVLRAAAPAPASARSVCNATDGVATSSRPAAAVELPQSQQRPPRCCRSSEQTEKTCRAHCGTRGRSSPAARTMPLAAGPRNQPSVEQARCSCPGFNLAAPGALRHVHATALKPSLPLPQRPILQAPRPTSGPRTPRPAGVSRQPWPPMCPPDLLCVPEQDAPGRTQVCSSASPQHGGHE